MRIPRWFFGIVLASCGAGAAAQQVQPPSRESDVRLLVSISVDQMLPDHFERLAPWLRGGLGRFAKDGFVFERASLQYGETETAPGHTCMGTGLLPVRHGIVGNDWIALDQSRSTYCFEDPQARLVTSAGKTAENASSPRNLRAPGIADHLRALDPRSRACAISSKDRSAIGMSGQRANVALWWDKKRGGFVSSTWFGEDLPVWAREWSAGWLERLAAGEFGSGWRHALPADLEGSRTAPDESEGEVGRSGERSFPHRTPRFTGELDEKQLEKAAGWVYAGPAGDVCVAQLAQLAQRELELGEGDALDLLCVSLSSCDTVGHGYGPYSYEVTDVLLRADRLLEALFVQLDERVGAGRWVASLTADHGVMDLPEALEARGVDAGRISSKVLSGALDTVRPIVAAKFGADFYLAHHSRGVRLSLSRMKEAKVEPAAVRKLYASELRKAGEAWLEHVVTFDELEGIARSGRKAKTELIALEAGSFDEERTCDVVLLAKRHYLMGLAAGTTHGTPHDYDRAIPLAFYGAGVKPGRSTEAASSIDVLPTLFALAGLKAPEGLDGRARLVR